jgi:hypothetical protein
MKPLQYDDFDVLIERMRTPSSRWVLMASGR